MISQIITGNETWALNITPESKQPSKAVTVMAQDHGYCVDRHGVVIVSTVYADRNINQHRSLLCDRAIQNKRCGRQTKGILLLLDNALQFVFKILFILFHGKFLISLPSVQT